MLRGKKPKLTSRLVDLMVEQIQAQEQPRVEQHALVVRLRRELQHEEAVLREMKDEYEYLANLSEMYGGDGEEDSGE